MHKQVGHGHVHQNNQRSNVNRRSTVDACSHLVNLNSSHGPIKGQIDVEQVGRHVVEQRRDC